MALPKHYAWLTKEPAPRMLVEALKLYGTLEKPGATNNPTIMAWAAETGLAKTYSADSVPWCGLFMAVVAQRAAKPVVDGPLWALNWNKWGSEGGQPELGDVLTFQREGGGHVALYVGEDDFTYHVLGGNQSDAVTVTRIAKERMRACRQHFAVGKPANVRPIRLSPTGAVSTNEA